MSGNMPVPATYMEVAAILRTMADLAEAGDSFEGSIEYSMPMPPDDPPDAEVMVRAAYRVGNLAGQGGLRIIGTMNTPRSD